MEKEKIKEKFNTIFDKISFVKEKLDSLNPSLKLIFIRKDIREYSKELSIHSKEFNRIDKEFGDSLETTGNINASIITAANYAIVANAREIARSALADAQQNLSNLNSLLNFYASLLVAIIALIVAILK